MDGRKKWLEGTLKGRFKGDKVGLIDEMITEQKGKEFPLLRYSYGE